MIDDQIVLQNITKAFGNQKVFSNLSAAFTKNQIICIMGPSGTGKTTLLNLMMNLITPDEGTIIGLDNSKFAVVFQEDRLLREFDAITNIQLVMPKKTPIERIRKELELVGLSDYERKPVEQLSGGMKRRVAIVRAILAPSDIVIMDEPFKGLDDVLKQTVIEYIKKHMKGKTAFIVTHDYMDAKRLGAKIYNLPIHGKSDIIACDK